jgi:hypothetical protein
MGEHIDEVKIEQLLTSETDGQLLEELVRQGEELDKVESKYGIWESMKTNKMALVYSMSRFDCQPRRRY